MELAKLRLESFVEGLDSLSGLSGAGCGSSTVCCFGDVLCSLLASSLRNGLTGRISVVTGRGVVIFTGSAVSTGEAVFLKKFPLMLTGRGAIGGGVLT